MARLRRSSTTAGWPEAFEPVDQRCPPEATTVDQLRERRFELAGHTVTLQQDDWNPAGTSQLWRYHLHYWEWAWPLINASDGRTVFEPLWTEWQTATRVGRGDAWSPYVVVVRAWALCGLHRHLVQGATNEDAYLESLQVHAGHVLAHLELDVGGNHLMKNIKALFGLGLFFDDATLLGRGHHLLARELPVQVLDDGGHFERSPSYHAQVLADLIDIHDLLAASGHRPPDALSDSIDRMRRWLAVMLMPGGTVPLLRDCIPVPADRLDVLGVDRSRQPERLVVLPDSGYVVADTGRLHAVLDVGQPCPRRLPAHAQADSLNWVLHVGGQPAVIDTGTSSYQDPETRAYERSTAAHSTVEIDGEDSTEVFGSFRAGRRATVQLGSVVDDGTTITVKATHDGYRFLPGSPVHHRTWTIGADTVGIVDRVTGSGHHTVTARSHLADPEETPVRSEPPGTTTTSPRSVGMGRRVDGTVHVVKLSAELPVEVRTVIERRGDPQPGGDGAAPTI